MGLLVVAFYSLAWPPGYKTFFVLSSAENFPTNKYENANNSWHVHIIVGIFYLLADYYFHSQLRLARKKEFQERDVALMS